MLIKRTLSEKIIALAGKFPIVSITGPRQSGKTTLAQMIFKDYGYVNLEDPEEREFAQNDPKGFLNRFPQKVVFDEIQRVPDLLSYIQVIVDRDDSPGRFILTGSQQIHLIHKISQTLAGRTAIVNLLPLSLAELQGKTAIDPYRFDAVPDPEDKPGFGFEDIIFKGLYPRIHDKDLAPHDWFSSYYQTYVERDVRDIINIGNLDTFQRFIRLCAGRTGQLLNLSSLASDCGITHPTARQWISILQTGFIIFLLQPYYKNFSKRIVKTPKLYFHDTGLLCYLLRIRDPSDIQTHAMRGSIFEDFIVSEIYKSFCHIGEVPPLYFWRDRTGHEVDVIIEMGKRLVPVEIKSSETVIPSFFDGLRYFLTIGAEIDGSGVVVYGGDKSYKRDISVDKGSAEQIEIALRPWFQCS